MFPDAVFDPDMAKPFEKPIYVTRPFLPPLDKFCDGLKEIWDNQWLTNNGPVLKRYTRELSNYFETDKIIRVHILIVHMTDVLFRIV